MVILAAIAAIWLLFGRKKTNTGTAGQTYELQNGVTITYGDTPGSATVTYPDGSTTELTNGEVSVDVLISQGVDIETAILLSANSKAMAAYSDAVDAAQAASGYSTETAGYHYDENGNWVPDNRYLDDPNVAIAKCKADIANYEVLINDLENNPSLSTSTLVQERLAWARQQLAACQAALAALEAGGTVPATDTKSWTLGVPMTVIPASGETDTGTETVSNLRAIVGDSVPDLSTLDNLRNKNTPEITFSAEPYIVGGVETGGVPRIPESESQQAIKKPNTVQELDTQRTNEQTGFAALRSRYNL
jgi:hypothetical protein